MSDSSGNNSRALQKGFFKRMLNQEESKSAKQPEVKQRHPGFVVSNEAPVTPGRMSKPQAPGVVISPAVKQLNKDGYVVFNTPEKEDVYITIQPDSAFFDDEEPPMIKMAGGSFVGTKHAATIEAPIRQEPEAAPIVYTQPADIFSNAARRDELDEIDFSEIIIKKNEAFEEEIEEAPVLLFTPNYGGIAPTVVKAAYTEVPLKTAETASAVIDTKGISPINVYREVPDYKVQDVVGIPSRVTEVPSGLYVDGHKPISTAESEDNGMFVIPSFIEAKAKAEAAVTSEAVPMTAAVVSKMPADAPATPVAAEPPTDITASEETEIIVEDICVTAAEESTGTVTDVPAPLEIDDPVADIMKLTVPGLYMSEGLMAELAADMETAIPEDGLESYDYKFEPAKVSAEKNDPPHAAFFGI